MDDVATQPSTQPFYDPRRLGHNGSMLSIQDESDVICILHPSSQAAFAAVQLVASSTPQHILSNQGLSRVFQEIDDNDLGRSTRPDEDSDHNDTDDTSADNDVMSDEETQRKGSTAHDIALRLSSRVRDPCMGFIFGRNPQKCDIILGFLSEHQRLSNMHFRIYITKDGIVMLQDMSTNGTAVDDVLLKVNKTKSDREDKKRMLNNGSVIRLFTSIPSEEIKFIVSMPSRDRAALRYDQRLSEYLAYVAQTERQALVVANARANGTGMAPPPIPVNPLSEDLLATETGVNPNPGGHLTAGSAKYHFGMHWSGGEKYNVVGWVGKGSFAMVYLLATKQHGETYAVKELEKRRFIKNGILNQKLDNEIQIMKDLIHPNIVRFHDYADFPAYLYIVMDYVPGGDLSKYLNNHGYMLEGMAKSVSRQISQALNYLHKRKITHRDVKPDNILIAAIGPIHVKLSDFGLSKFVDEKETFLKTFCGTMQYCAPEIYPDYGLYHGKKELPPPPRKRRRSTGPTPTTAPYSRAVDVWSFAAVMFHLLAGKPAYTGMVDDHGASMLDGIFRNGIDFGPLKLGGVSDDAIDFLTKMLVTAPKLRPTFDECLRHPWVKDVADVAGMDLVEEPLPENLDIIQEDDEHGIDASLLSLQDHHDDLDMGGDDENSDVDEIDRNRVSKRFKVAHQNAAHGEPGDLLSAGSLYPALPTINTEQTHAVTSHPLTTNRLFGEIGNSALASSGVLGHDAHMALEMQMEGSDDGTSITTDRSHTSRVVNNAHESRGIISEPAHGSAPSLFGAEALVGQLNMASPVSIPSAPLTPQTPRTREQSPLSTSGLMGSNLIHHIAQPTHDETVPKRARLGSRTKRGNSHSHHDHSTNPSSRNSAGTLGASGRDDVGNQLSWDESSAEFNATGIAEDSSYIGSIDRLLEEAGEGNHEYSTVQSYNDDTVRKSATSTNVQLAQSHSGRIEGANVKVTDDASVTNDPGFIRPPHRFGKLTSISGSISNITIPLEQRVTKWGRNPICTVHYPDLSDIRIPKIALCIIFWCPGIESLIEKGIDWTTIKDVSAIVATQSTQNIWVNDVKLTKGTPTAWHYGKLQTGDRIKIFGPLEDGAFLTFKCEFNHGSSREKRAKGTPFVVEIEEDHFVPQGAESVAGGQREGGVVQRVEGGLQAVGGAQATEGKDSAKGQMAPRGASA